MTRRYHKALHLASNVVSMSSVAVFFKKDLDDFWIQSRYGHTQRPVASPVADWYCCGNSPCFFFWFSWYLCLGFH